MALAAVALITVVYHRVWMPVVPGAMDPDDFGRGIGSPLLLWVNGYLGVFLHLRYLGTTGALAIPLLFFGLWHWRHLAPWLRGLLAFTLIAVAVIGGFGGFNYGYALTLQPLLVVAVVAAGWQLFTGRERVYFLASLALVSVVNTVLAMEHRQRIWKASSTFSSPDTGAGDLRDRLASGPEDLDAMLRRCGVGPRDTVLVNNVPVWYYDTDRFGIYYWCGSDQLFMGGGKTALFGGRTDHQAHSYLLDSLHCRYVFSTVEYAGYDARFDSLLARDADLLEMDKRGYTMHRVRDTLRH
ncbi:MAG: hypothetical protein IPK99_00985 [Flavobacteriales bacterium]|nr:hypothetical protein [Flavobacteriales bacterium]